MGRVVVVTGAAGAIGSSICARFAAAGDSVIGLDAASGLNIAGGLDATSADIEDSACTTTEEAALADIKDKSLDYTEDEVCADIEASSLGLEMVACDVSDEDQVISAFNHIRRKFGHPVVLINNSGITGAGGVEDETPSIWRRIIDVNLTGAYLCAREVVGGMRSSGGGRIVNIASVNARFGGSKLSGPAYAASKGGLLTLTRFLAREHAVDKINVNAVAPGPHDTPMWSALNAQLRERILATVPGPAPGAATDLAAVVEFLCGAHADYITGATIDVNGGQWMG